VDKYFICDKTGADDKYGRGKYQRKREVVGDDYFKYKEFLRSNDLPAYGKDDSQADDGEDPRPGGG
jgi:hypothetical protein